MNGLYLTDDFLTNNKNYFFYIFPPQFNFIADLWKDKLKKIYTQEFEPIFVSSFYNPRLEGKNYLILNSKNKFYKKQSFSLSARDLNKEFSNLDSVNDLIINLLKRQKEILVIPYTTSELIIKHKNVTILGPNSKIVNFLDNKANAYNLFKKLKLKCLNFKIFPNLASINLNNLIYPNFISASFSSGSSQSKILNNKEDFFNFKNNLNEENKKNKFVLVDYIDKKIAIESSAYVLSNNKIIILNIIDEISNGTICVGNIYPSSINDKIRKQIEYLTCKIGNYISSLGFRGNFGCGFILDKNNNLYISDLNPRKQGFYIGDFLFSNVSPIDLDIFTFLKLKLKLPNKIFSKKINGFWAYYQSLVSYHFYLKPFFKNKENDLLNFKKYIYTSFWETKKIILSRNAFYIQVFAKTYKDLLGKIKKKEIELIFSYVEKENILKIYKNKFKKNIFYRIVRFFYKKTIVIIYIKIGWIRAYLDPSITFIKEIIYSYFLLDYRISFIRDIDKEISLLKDIKLKKILFIGGGALPYSSILLSRKLNCKVDILEKNKFAYLLGKRYLKINKIKNISYFNNNSINFKNYKDYDLIYFASQMVFKNKSFNFLFKEINRHTRVIIRLSKNYISKYNLDINLKKKNIIFFKLNAKLHSLFYIEKI